MDPRIKKAIFNLVSTKAATLNDLKNTFNIDIDLGELVLIDMFEEPFFNIISYPVSKLKYHKSSDTIAYDYSVPRDTPGGVEIRSIGVGHEHRELSNYLKTWYILPKEFVHMVEDILSSYGVYITATEMPF